MDLALKKVELISWLTKQDQAMIDKIENLRKLSIESQYSKRMSEDFGERLYRSNEDIIAGRVHEQKDVESYFKDKFSN
jgi:hypothetical protein